MVGHNELDRHSAILAVATTADYTRDPTRWGSAEIAAMCSPAEASIFFLIFGHFLLDSVPFIGIIARIPAR
jgi:hypothetical protein